MDLTVVRRNKNDLDQLEILEVEIFALGMQRNLDAFDMVKKYNNRPHSTTTLAHYPFQPFVKQYVSLFPPWFQRSVAHSLSD